MTKLQKKLAALLSASAMVLNTTPVFAASYNFSVIGNGSDSENEIELETNNNTQVTQRSTSDVRNEINVTANTGDNDVEDNTGGDVDVKTGNTNIGARITNDVNWNEASVDLCDCQGGDVDVKVSGNGSDSENEVDIERDNNTTLVQTNNATVRNRLNFDAQTGDNDVEDNTGGEVELTTGKVTMVADVANLANRNFAVVGGSNGNGGSDVDLELSGNGSDSENEVELEFDNEIGIWQTNTTLFDNDFLFAGNTGDNDLEDNTAEASDDPSLTTGDVMVDAVVGNIAGFNVASADCGCVLDIEGSISGNGTDSENEVELEFDNELTATQDNDDELRNRLDVDAETGDNDVEDNTGGEVNASTGTSTSIFDIFNLGGVNLFGDVEFDFPWESEA